MQSKPPRTEMKAFRLSFYAIDALEKLSKRLSHEARTQISMAKAIELAIFNAEHLTLIELLNPKPRGK